MRDPAVDHKRRDTIPMAAAPYCTRDCPYRREVVEFRRRRAVVPDEVKKRLPSPCCKADP